MTGGVLGGGVIFVVAALLWAAVLVPNWMRRREFRAAERNAARLQRTLRVLAETAEVPQEMRVEATAKQALAHEKLLRTAQRRQEAERAAKLAAERTEQVKAELRAQQIQRQQVAMQRIAKLKSPGARAVRVVAAIAALGGIIGVLVGAGLALAGAGSLTLIISAGITVVGFGGLVLLAPGRVRTVTVDAELLEPAKQAKPVEAPAVEPVATGETDAAAEAHAAAQQAAAERIQTAQAKARARAARPAPRENQPDSILLQEVREQIAQSQTEAPSAVAAPAPTRRSVQVASQSSEAQRRAAAIARSGVIGDAGEGLPNLDEVLRRRRAG